MGRNAISGNLCDGLVDVGIRAGIAPAKQSAQHVANDGVDTAVAALVTTKSLDGFVLGKEAILGAETLRADGYGHLLAGLNIEQPV